MEYAQMISTYGFPIVACLGMAWYVKYITDKNNDRMDTSNKQHAEEISNITAAINNNTIALTKLLDRIDKEGK